MAALPRARTPEKPCPASTSNGVRESPPVPWPRRPRSRPTSPVASLTTCAVLAALRFGGTAALPAGLDGGGGQQTRSASRRGTQRGTQVRPAAAQPLVVATTTTAVDFDAAAGDVDGFAVFGASPEGAEPRGFAGMCALCRASTADLDRSRLRCPPGRRRVDRAWPHCEVRVPGTPPWGNPHTGCSGASSEQ